MRRLLIVSMILLGIIVVVIAPADAHTKMKLRSPAFAPGTGIPDGFTCDGEDASPPLRWSGVPAATVELAIVMKDPDAPLPSFTHWTAWHIDPNSNRLPEQTLPEGVVQGRNSVNREGYMGPCPPPGAAHHYRFTLYALRPGLDLAEGASVADLTDALRGKVIAKATLVGTYARATSTNNAA